MTILNFHGLGPLPRKIDEGEYSCWLDETHFEAILDHIQGNDEIMITFDDGNESDFNIALPALLKRGMTAVFFICSGRIGGPGFLSVSQCRELVSNGMTVGSHGVDHTPWRTLGRNALEREVKDSRRVLEEICGVSVDMAACPFGSYDRRVLGTLKNAGYRAIFTSDGGSASDTQWLRARTTIKRAFTIEHIDSLLLNQTCTVGRFLHQARIFLKRNRPCLMK